MGRQTLGVGVGVGRWSGRKWGLGWLKPHCQGTPLPAEPSWASPPPPASAPLVQSYLTCTDNRGCCFILPSSAPGMLRGPGSPGSLGSLRWPGFPLPRLQIQHAKGDTSPTLALPDPLPVVAWGRTADRKAGVGRQTGYLERQRRHRRKPGQLRREMRTERTSS